MYDSAPVQLSFDVGGDKPDIASMKVSGALRLSRELKKGEEVGIRIITADGELIAEADGRVTGVSFKDRLGKFNEGRVHRAGAHRQGRVR